MDQQTDRLGQGVRFGCGAVFGVVVGLSVIVSSLPAAWLDWVVVLGGAAVVCGLLAMWFGDQFWEWVGRWGWW